jgi:hypothetical protein
MVNHEFILIEQSGHHRKHGNYFDFAENPLL